MSTQSDSGHFHGGASGKPPRPAVSIIIFGPCQPTSSSGDWQRAVAKFPLGLVFRVARCRCALRHPLISPLPGTVGRSSEPSPQVSPWHARRLTNPTWPAPAGLIDRTGPAAGRSPVPRCSPRSATCEQQPRAYDQRHEKIAKLSAVSTVPALLGRSRLRISTGHNQAESHQPGRGWPHAVTLAAGSGPPSIELNRRKTYRAVESWHGTTIEAAEGPGHRLRPHRN